MRACLLVPIYDHGDTIGGVLRSLEPHGLPCFVIDDGSGEATRRELERLAGEHPWIEVERRTKNGGRGAALRTGYRLASQRGMTHAIQLDADAQHDAADVPRFLEAAQKHPSALVLGAPVFDESAPLVRVYGRKLSKWLVWLETFSFRIGDPLCGFRCFPLEATLALLDRSPLGNRMDFDPEIAVRLVWAGVPVVNVETRVRYHEGGISHFNMLVDNGLIAWAHTRLVLGALLRAPLLLARPGSAQR